MDQANDVIAFYATGEWGMGANTGRRIGPTHQEIARLAFSIYESRGRQDGYHFEDWLRAEQELLRHYA